MKRRPRKITSVRCVVGGTQVEHRSSTPLACNSLLAGLSMIEMPVTTIIESKAYHPLNAISIALAPIDVFSGLSEIYFWAVASVHDGEPDAHAPGHWRHALYYYSSSTSCCINRSVICFSIVIRIRVNNGSPHIRFAELQITSAFRRSFC